MKNLLHRIKNYKSTIDGISILCVVLSVWLAPESATEVAAAIGTIWGAIKILQKDN